VACIARLKDALIGKLDALNSAEPTAAQYAAGERAIQVPTRSFQSFFLFCRHSIFLLERCFLFIVGTIFSDIQIA
jgi:hypothetical protein